MNCPKCFFKIDEDCKVCPNCGHEIEENKDVVAYEKDAFTLDLCEHEPFFGGWTIVRQIGDGEFSRIYKISHEEYGRRKYAAMKVISVPQDAEELKKLKAEGMDDETLKQRFDGFAKDIEEEFKLFHQLKDNANIVSFEDCVILPQSDGIGSHILIRMELLESLADRMKENDFTSEEVAKLGVDICNALEIWQNYDIVHRALNPGNILVSEQGDYQLGDFGLARILGQGRNARKVDMIEFMAPEIYMGEDGNSTSDIYSLGLIMYELTNQKRMPFIPSEMINFSTNDADQAIDKRMKGMAMAAPSDGDLKLIPIILRACAYRPEDRYQSAKALREALEKYLRGEDVNANRKDTHKTFVGELKRQSKDFEKEKTKFAMVEDNASTMSTLDVVKSEKDAEPVYDKDALSKLKKKAVPDTQKVELKLELKDDEEEFDQSKIRRRKMYTPVATPVEPEEDHDQEEGEHLSDEQSNKLFKIMIASAIGLAVLVLVVWGVVAVVSKDKAGDANTDLLANDDVSTQDAAAVEDAVTFDEPEPVEPVADEVVVSENSTDMLPGGNVTVEVTESVRVRAEASTEAQALETVYKGARFTCYESMDDGWSKIDYNGTIAYIKTEFLVVVDD